MRTNHSVIILVRAIDSIVSPTTYIKTTTDYVVKIDSTMSNFLDTSDTVTFPLTKEVFLACSVTRLGENSPLKQNLKPLWQILKGPLSIWQILEHT